MFARRLGPKFVSGAPAPSVVPPFALVEAVWLVGEPLGMLAAELEVALKVTVEVMPIVVVDVLVIGVVGLVVVAWVVVPPVTGVTVLV